MKNVFKVGNLIYLLIDNDDNYGSKIPMYVIYSVTSGVNLNTIMLLSDLLEAYPDGKFYDNIDIFNNSSEESKDEYLARLVTKRVAEYDELKGHVYKSNSKVVITWDGSYWDKDVDNLYHLREQPEENEPELRYPE